MRQDEYRDEPFTVLEADFYGANSLLPLSDEELVAKVLALLLWVHCLLSTQTTSKIRSLTQILSAMARKALSKANCSSYELQA